jgi:hypothetical protein
MSDAALEPITDDLVLAAVERAECHQQRRGVSISRIKAHLAAPVRTRRARQVNATVAALADVGLLEHFREHSQDYWTLTESARERLRGRFNMAERLPESPQHKHWRTARRIAGQELERYREVLRAVLTEAMALLDVPEGSPASEEWFKMSRRLGRHAERVGSATHCLLEWQEPSDDVADEYGGRRSYHAWRTVDEDDAWEAKHLTA